MVENENMVLWHITFNIDKDKVKEYSKLASEEIIPFWMKQKGIKEFRAYRLSGSTKVLTMMDFESNEAWGKAIDNYLKTGIPDKFTAYTHDMSWIIYNTSPLVPEALKPK